MGSTQKFKAAVYRINDVHSWLKDFLNPDLFTYRHWKTNIIKFNDRGGTREIFSGASNYVF